RPASSRAGRGFPRCSTGVQEWESDRKSDLDNVVPDAQEAHRARHGETRPGEDRHSSGNGDDRRSGSASRTGICREDAIFQPEKKDCNSRVVSIKKIIESYDPHLPLDAASTIPASWYLDPEIAALEQRTVFARSWQVAGRTEQVQDPGQYITCE